MNQGRHNPVKKKKGSVILEVFFVNIMDINQDKYMYIDFGLFV
jgi:hypothetical protein